jgi:hypothetical protein
VAQNSVFFSLMAALPLLAVAFRCIMISSSSFFARQVSSLFLHHHLKRTLVSINVFYFFFSLQARFILLAPATATFSSTVAVPVVVRLRDDLAGSCKPGDFVTCTGIAECITEICSQGRPAFAAVRVEALHVLHHPTALANCRRHEESLSPTNFIATKPNPLTFLLGSLNDWLHPPCSSLTLAALLLSSACSTGTASPPSTALSTSDEIFADAECDTINLSKSRDASCGKRRINILLLTAGHDSLETSLSPLAQALCSHVTHGGIPGSNLLPSVLEMFGSFSLVEIGQLGQANSGVCLLSQPLGAKHGRAVGEALQAGHATVALPSGQTCTVELNPTIWCLSAAPDLLSKQTAGQKFNKFASTSKTACKNEAPLAVLFAEKSSPQLAAQFDVVLDCASIEDESAEAWADDYLAALVAGEPAEERAARREKARLALQDHISTCQQLAQPTMTPSAMGFLKSYWTATRSTASGNGCGVSAAFLNTAAKLAAASARLFHRTEVHTFPDATLAVALCEEGLIARGWNSELWGPWREQMVYGRDLVDCLSDFHKQIVRVSKQHGWEWDAREE